MPVGTQRCNAVYSHYEDRDHVDASITRESIETALSELGILLNVAVNRAFPDGSLLFSVWSIKKHITRRNRTRAYTGIL